MSEIDTTFKVNCASITTKKVKKLEQMFKMLSVCLDASFEAFSPLLNGLVQEVIQRSLLPTLCRKFF